jgi:hypothetical protein
MTEGPPGTSGVKLLDTSGAVATEAEDSFNDFDRDIDLQAPRDDSKTATPATLINVVKTPNLTLLGFTLRRALKRPNLSVNTLTCMTPPQWMSINGIRPRKIIAQMVMTYLYLHNEPGDDLPAQFYT